MINPEISIEKIDEIIKEKGLKGWHFILIIFKDYAYQKKLK